jgi:hypothetical protein
MPAVPGTTPFDTGNTLLDISQANFTAGKIPMPDGSNRLIWTIRTPSTTLTLFLTKTDGQTWCDAFQASVDDFSDVLDTTTPAPPNTTPSGLEIGHR